MFSRVCLLLLGAAYIYCQISTEGVYIGNLIVEGNISLSNYTSYSHILSQQLESLRNFQVNSSKVTILEAELTSECIVVGTHSIQCNCSDAYTWSNEVCYTYGCCNESACTKNVFHITPLCVAKVQVYLNGSVTLKNDTWNSTKASQLEPAFSSALNGFESLNITAYRLDNAAADFTVAVNVRLNTSALLSLVTELKTNFSAEVRIDTVGMVTITAPEDTVPYKSSPVLKCTFEEATESATWHLIREHSYFQLSIGTVVNLNSCVSGDCKSCTEITLAGVTGVWAGTYVCGFTTGSVTHTAKAQLRVALLPEEIDMNIKPSAVDCPAHRTITVTAAIYNSTEKYNISWEPSGSVSDESFTTSGDKLIYSVKFEASCQEMNKPLSVPVTVTFNNSKEQVKNGKVDIPVIYANTLFCKEEHLDVLWSKTPDGITAISKKCGRERTGNMYRKCEGTTWGPVISNCVSKKLKKVENEAEEFEMGLGATTEVAKNIFGGLKNTTEAADFNNTMAEISVAVNVLDLMARASENVTLTEDVLVDFLDAASNMLSKSWDHNQDLSSKYLESVEGLVQNIQVNTTRNISNANMDYQVCSDCNIFVFNVSVNLKPQRLLKTVAVKNLMDKLSNTSKQTEGNLEKFDILIIATIQNETRGPITISMDFPYEEPNDTRAICVFWDDSDKTWSEEGCKVQSPAGNSTICTCNHLTSFSMLFSKTSTDDKIHERVLGIITKVGLSVSICSLVILLITESLVWSAVVKTNLSHFRHTALVNIATFLLLADCSFLAGTSPKDLSEELCLTVTICKHLFFLAMFSWTLCMSAMLVHQLIFVFSPLRKRVLMFLSSIVGYACPILIVVISYLYCTYTGKKYYDKERCWLVHGRVLEASAYAFYLPVGTVIFINLFSMVVVILTLMKTVATDGSKADEKETLKGIIKVVLFLTPVFGVTWGVGFIQQILEEKERLIARYCFDILNSFQGLFVMLTGFFAEKRVQDELLKRMGRGKDASTQNSASHTKDK